MNNEILEISKWLSEKGFECDMWYQDYSQIENDSYNGFELVSEYVDDNHQPFFTLNRVLELLPGDIETEKYYYHLRNWKIDGHKDKLYKQDPSEQRYSYSYELYASKEGFHIPEFSSKERQLLHTAAINPHLAALRLLKKTVEEKYVKAN